MLVLRLSGRRGILHQRGRERTIAYGPAADFHGRRYVALDERGRHAQYVCNVVETLRGIVGGQQVDASTSNDRRS